MDHSCSNTPVDVTEWGLRGTNWTQTAANQWDPAHHAGGPSAFPRLLPNGTAILGGVPQVADIPKLMEMLKAEITTWIPDPEWTGNAVFDFEEYVPAWDLLEPNYRDYSRLLVHKAHPSWQEPEVDSAAKASFESAATHLFVQALETAKAVRPKAFWGFYDMPRNYCPHCNYSWFAPIVDASTAVYPSVYLKLPKLPEDASIPPTVRSYIRAQTFANFNRTVRASVELARGKPVYPFVSMFDLGPGSWTINGTKYTREKTTFLRRSDAAVEYLLPYSLGADGVVIWSGLGEEKSLNRNLAENRSFWKNFKQQTGPMTKAFLTEIAACATTHCSGHGRCMPRGSTQCQCFAGHTGAHCEIDVLAPSGESTTVRGRRLSQEENVVAMQPPAGAVALGYTNAVIDEAPTAADIAPNGTRTGHYKWCSGQWYAIPPSEYKYTTIDGVLALFLGGDLVSTAPGDMNGDGLLPLLPGADGFYVEFEVKLTSNDHDHWPAVWLMPIEHNGRQEDSPAGGQRGEPGDSMKFERWMELDVDEGGFGPGLTGTVHNWTGVYPKYHNTQNGNNVVNATLDRTVYHTYGASYDPKTQTVAWWLDGVKLIETAEDVPTIAAHQNFYLIVSCQSHLGVDKGDNYLMFVRRVRAFVPPEQ